MRVCRRATLIILTAGIVGSGAAASGQTPEQFYAGKTIDFVIGYPIWASDITAVTGKWRLETVEINGLIEIGGMRVAAGDLVVADDTGVCFIPRDLVLEVLEAAEQKAKAEAIRCKAIDDGVPVPDISRATYGDK